MSKLLAAKLLKQGGKTLLGSYIRALTNPPTGVSAHLKTPEVHELPEFLKSIEAKWATKLANRADRERLMESKESTRESTRYILSMFPYPSGRLHLGHVRIYVSGDLLTRFSKLLANNKLSRVSFKHVIYPMGFDSFGLPAENAAKERGLDPASWTNSNIRVMKKQLDDLSLQLDWREATSNPSYYKWTQDIFLKLFDAGLIYKSYARVNWDPIDKTVLADEQVDEEGRSWRSGALIERKNLRQWFVKTNALVHNIYRADDIDPSLWGDILAIQRNWMGEPSGWMFYLPILFESDQGTLVDSLQIYTRKPEMFLEKDVKLVISRDHWLEEIHQISRIGHINNPFNNSRLPVELTDLDSLPCNCHSTLACPEEPESDELLRNQVLMNAKLQGLGGYFTSDRYRDWLVSRQRFWGTPVPMIRDLKGDYKRVSSDSLPVVLPKVDFKQYSTDTSKDEGSTSPIERLAPRDWMEVRSSSGEVEGYRECETLDTLFDSSWYFLRYASSPPQDRAFDIKKAQPVWCYIGGKEHAAMHLFYARFITHFLQSIECLDFKEPFRKLLVQGLVKGTTYKLNGKYISETEAASLNDKKKLTCSFEKMSKSKGNGVDPQDLLNTYGIDATRLCLMSYANPRSERIWRSTKEEFKDVLIFLRRVILTVEDYVKSGLALSATSSSKSPVPMAIDERSLDEAKKSLNSTINRSSYDSIRYIQETNEFRQYISTLHVLVTALRSYVKTPVIYTKEFARALAALIVLINPVVPHLSEELWIHFSRTVTNPLRDKSASEFKLDMQVSDQPWPVPDEGYAKPIKSDRSKKHKKGSVLPGTPSWSPSGRPVE